MSIGNRPSGGRDFPGWIDEFRFYTGSGDANFIESIRQLSTPIVVSNLSPDGSTLMSGTNVLSFTASSTNGISNSGVKVSVNGADVTPSLVISGPSTALNVTYTGLPVNPTIISQSILNGVAVSILVTDNAGVVTSNSYVYDAFSPTNFTFESEDYDFGGGLFIDNPVVSFVGPDANTYYQEQTNYVNLTDANDNGNLSGPGRLYRDPAENVETEYSAGAGNNGGNSIGELWRQKVKDAYAITNIAGEVNVGYFDGGAGSGLPNWQNYTRTYAPAGNYNVFLRVADGAGTLSAALDVVTNGWGTSSQTTSNIGTFNMVNTGGWDTFAWVPLRDSGGNLIRLQLPASTNTLRLTAGSGGGGNINFVMLTPANTNLPVISNIYPNGTNLFQPSPTFSFVANSPTGVNISTNSVKVKLTVTTLLGQVSVLNLTATNGLTFTGPSTNRLVSTVLSPNTIYTAAISVTDAAGSPAANSVSFDTLNPSYTWEAPDYDFTAGQFIPDPIPVDGYLNLSGFSTYDFNFANVPPPNNYRDSGIVGVENNGDASQRLQYLTNNPAPQPYDLGYFNGGNWLNYTRNFPSGDYNVYVRAADGSTTAGGSVGVSVVTSGWGTSSQTTSNLGSFNFLPTGGWQTYVWAPLRDVGGNLVKFTGGTTNTLRTTSSGSQNVFFYALFPANTNLPTINNVLPASGSQLTNTFSFNIKSAAGVSTNSIVFTVNGITVSNLVFSGSSTNWNVTWPHLTPNTPYIITITLTDGSGNTATTTVSFDTMNPGNYTWECEDFDYNSGLFIPPPQTNAYAGQAAVPEVDTHQVNFAGAYVYRSPGMDTEINGDVLRPQYQDINNPQPDYTMGFFSDGAWANYTRVYPPGSYNVYGRFATASATGTDAQLSVLTSGWGTSVQTSNLLGTFTLPNTGGWESYAFIPLRDASGKLVTVTLNGSTNTLQLIRPTDVPASGDVNANYIMLAPILTASAAQVGTNVVISFPTLTGFKYQVIYTTNLSHPNWLPLGGLVSGNNGTQTVSDPVTSGQRFYRVQLP